MMMLVSNMIAASDQHQRRRRSSLKALERLGQVPPLELQAGAKANEELGQTKTGSKKTKGSSISTSSNDTVIAGDLNCATLGLQDSESPSSENQATPTRASGKTAGALRNLFAGLFASHTASNSQHLFAAHKSRQSAPNEAELAAMLPEQLAPGAAHQKPNAELKCSANLLVAFAQKYLNFGASGESRDCQSCPATPTTAHDKASGSKRQKANGFQAQRRAEARPALTPRPSVRFLESGEPADATPPARRFLGRHIGGGGGGGASKLKFAHCGVQTTNERNQQGQAEVPLEPDQAARHHFLSAPFVEDDATRAKLVEQLFSQTGGANSTAAPSSGPPKAMDSSEFRNHGYKLIDYICNYLDTIRERRVTPLNIEPGYLKALIQPAAPEQGEPFAAIMHDFEAHIMCGLTHWQHPHFHAYFPAGNAYPSILADMLSDALGCVGFSWAASPAYTELEIIMLDWMGKMIGLPDEFLCLSSNQQQSTSRQHDNELEEPRASTTSRESRGGGVIQGSASECVLVNLLAARHWAMEKLRQKYPQVPDGLLLSKLIGYCSKEAHSCVEKAAMIGFIRMRALETDERHSLRGPTLARAIESDLAAGLEPFIVCATLGTTSCVSFDNLRELGEVCRDHDHLWLHVDAAYAGSALICPEFKYLMDGIELATSFNMNPNKWLLINFDCSLMWVKDRFKLTRAFVVDPLYLQHSFSDQAIDYRHWGIPLSRRFRALKLWFVIRNYGIEGLREYIRNHVRLAKLFAHLVEQDKRFTITNEVTLGLVCFRLVGSNALNQRLLSMINASGRLHMVPASLNGRYIIRFCVCDQNAQEQDIRYAYECISQTAGELFELIKAGKERIRAISQQNTIDVSSVSLHTQQSLSADQQQRPLSDGSGKSDLGHLQQVLAAGDEHEQQCQLQPAVRAQLGRPEAALVSTRRARSPLTKQVSMQAAGVVAAESECQAADVEADVELEAAFLDDYALDEYADFEVALERERGSSCSASSPLNQAASQQQQSASAHNDSISPIQRGRLSRSSGKSSRASYSRAATTTAASSSGATAASARDTRREEQEEQEEQEDEEASDELVKLIDKRNRMSLRYKREFFVRVVSDPRVYRASISGDINAHQASSSSLNSPASSAAQLLASEPQQQQSQPQPQQPPVANQLSSSALANLAPNSNQATPNGRSSSAAEGKQANKTLATN